jgi:hypothetical protein
MGFPRLRARGNIPNCSAPGIGRQNPPFDCAQRLLSYPGFAEPPWGSHAPSCTENKQLSSRTLRPSEYPGVGAAMHCHACRQIPSISFQSLGPPGDTERTQDVVERNETASKEMAAKLGKARRLGPVPTPGAPRDGETNALRSSLKRRPGRRGGTAALGSRPHSGSAHRLRIRAAIPGPAHGGTM